MADPLYSQVVHPETQPTAYENMQKKNYICVEHVLTLFCYYSLDNTVAALYIKFTLYHAL